MKYGNKKTVRYRKQRKPKTVRVVQRNPIEGVISTRKPALQSTTKTIKMRYVCDDTVVAPAGGAVGTVVIKANGIFDPETAVGGHQPLYHDQMMELYNHYKVLRSTIKVFFNSSATNNVADNLVFGIKLDDDGAVINSITNVMEQPAVKWMLGHNCPKYNEVSELNRGLTMTYTPKSFFGTHRKDDDDITALFGTDPAELASFVIFVASLPATANNCTVNLTICVDYTVQCSEAKDVISS